MNKKLINYLISFFLSLILIYINFILIGKFDYYGIDSKDLFILFLIFIFSTISINYLIIKFNFKKKMWLNILFTLLLFIIYEFIIWGIYYIMVIIYITLSFF